MVLYIVGDFIKAEKNIHFSGELERMLEFQPPENIQVISPEGLTIHGDKAKITPKDLIYFGHAGKNIEGVVSQTHGVVQEFDRYQKMFDNYKNMRFANPLELLKENLSKNYLIELSSDSSIPSIETQKVESFDDLIVDDDLFVKPLISERAAGAHRLKELNRKNKKDLFEQYSTNGIKQQGLILQPFIPGILDHGERKVAVIGGEITLCRLVNPDGSYQNTEISKKEIRICNNVWEMMSEKYPGIAHARIDLVGDPNNALVNEIEAVNPNISTRKSLNRFSDSQVENHYKKLYETLFNLNQN